MKTVLIATDFSDGASHAAEYGYNLAKQLKADVILCNAVLVPADVAQVGMVVWPADNYEAFLDSSTKQLEILKTQLRTQSDKRDFKPDISCIIQVGSVNDLVNGIIEKHEIALVVMGTHGSSGLSTFLMGNHCRSMIDYAARPLLLIPPQVAIKPINKIVFAADFKNAKDDLVSFYALILLAKTLQAEIVLAHIYHDKLNTPENNEWVKQSLTKLAISSHYTNISFKYIQNDKTKYGLQNLCKQEEADVLAMIHQPHNFIDSMLHGSHTQYMANHTSIPLLVFPG
ncbi:MAG: universal stress protein UspE [Daejeonella sp.]|nr:universal stress protein UspE [Daejeonella sp.]